MSGFKLLEKLLNAYSLLCTFLTMITTAIGMQGVVLVLRGTGLASPQLLLFL